MWEHKKDIDVEEKGDAEIKGVMSAFRDKVKAHRVELTNACNVHNF